MNKMIKMLSIFALLISATVFVNAQAQTTGTVQFDVSVQPAFDLRANGPATASSGVVVNAQTANDALGATVTVSDASPNAGDTDLTANVPIRMRSNATYKLTALRSGASVVSGADFESSDIKMEIAYSTRLGLNVDTGGSDTIVSGWSGFSNSVGTLTPTAVKIAGGDRISTGGNNLSTDNFVAASLNFKIARAYYTPITSYTDQVTVAIVAGP